VTEAGDYRFFAGWRSDPYFFDRRGALNNLQFTGDDYFADQDVCSIVVEVPNSALGPKALGLWHLTLVPAHGAGGGWITAERGARPLQLFLVLGLTSAERCRPRRGAGRRSRFHCPLRARAGAHGWVYDGGSTAGGRDTLPEILPYDPTRPASFPDNGRTLTDDAVDAFLSSQMGR
jgi:hypothetical protein